MTSKNYSETYKQLTDLDASMDDMLVRFGEGLRAFYQLNTTNITQKEYDKTMNEVLVSLNDVKVDFQHLTDAIEKIEKTINTQREGN